MSSNRKFALQTFLLIPLWVFSLNFNAPLIGPDSPTPYADAQSSGKSTYKIRKVVLDAGHGGKDPGCLGKHSKEKHQALAIVLKVGALIEKHYPEIEVIYTRKKDVFVELHERAAIANRNDADLFISVHCNALTVARAHGAETYVMGLHTAQHNLEVAKRENASIYLEENYKEHYEGYDPDSPEAHILGSVWQSAYLDQSILFASSVQKYAKKIGGRSDRGVKQAGFIVLKESAMPAVLIEAGFLTNLAEEKFLTSKEGHDKMAMAIFYAFEDYKNQMEATSVAGRMFHPEPIETKPKPVRSVADNPPSAYRIHLISWPTRLDTNSGLLSLLSDVKEVRGTTEYHYYLGHYKDQNEANKMLAEVRNLGFRTASLAPVLP